jgi:hypothetical protein
MKGLLRVDNPIIGKRDLFAMARTLDGHRFLFTKHPETLLARWRGMRN